MTERALILIWRLGPISLSSAKLNEVLASIPADGKPSARTGKEFNCRTWVFDVLVKLHGEGGLKLGVEFGKHDSSYLKLWLQN